MEELFERMLEKSEELKKCSEERLKSVCRVHNHLFGEKIMYDGEEYIVLALFYGKAKMFDVGLDGCRVESEIMAVLGKNFIERIEVPLKEVVALWRIRP